ncbi:zinc ribbon domain-containing protein [Bacillus hominis]|uniref:zinc ribbon domain-containing protein n=1 Tax=Bacillus hominis TaxID=2817478 RepID=UPI0025A07586|nr:zinc ribbon domain-containing protein [Bacillus hominis]MDM5435866.1 zinc ribbon domain-containing protein [Bacillus hominis]
MSDLQTTLGSGMNKLQEGIEQGKQKLQIAQEIAQLKKGIQVQMQKKAGVLLELGQQVYVQLRGNGVNEASLKEMISPIQEFDVAIYQARKRIVELQKQQGEKATCECGGPLSINDRFCGSCGNPNPMLAVESNSEQENCITCNEYIDKNATYCPVCGIKQSGE